MSDTGYPHKEVLEAIDHLRSRKARPDITRISTYLFKYYNFSYEETKQNLAKCVEDATVFRVEYKGCISYRNAAKSNHGKLIGNVDRKRVPSAGLPLLSTAFNELKSHSPEIAAKGISRLRFIAILLHKYPQKSHGYFNLLIDRSINRGLFTKLPNGNVLPKNKSTKPKRTDRELQEQRLATPRSKKTPKMMSPMQRKRWLMKQRTPKDRYRTLDRRKRIIKKVFDPSETKTKEIQNEKTEPDKIVVESDNEVEIELPDNVPESPDYRICAVCQQLVTDDKNYKKVTTCISCSSLSHFRCAYANPDVKESPKNSWKCPQCVHCKNCKRTSLMIPLIRCSNCNAAYHKRCHRPYIGSEIEENNFWFCISCRKKLNEDIEIVKSKFFCTPGHKSRLRYDPSEHREIWQNFKPSVRKFGADEEEVIDQNIPDIKNWSEDQIYSHMYNICPGGALSFKDRNIDGAYLLKMSRVEVLQGLGLKLGPALKIFKEVIILQKRRNDPKSYYL